MAIKTFSAGEQLTASDTNTYLANSGLVYVTSTTIGTGVTTKEVLGCFSSTYDNYRVIINGVVPSNAAGNMQFQLRPTSTANYNAGYYGVLPYAGGAALATAVDNNAAVFGFIGGAAVTGGATVQTSFDVLAPNLTQPTVVGPAIFAKINGANFDVGNYNGAHCYATAYTGFAIQMNTGTMTGGTITVYGYRKA